jgi:Predicted membrane protein
MAGLPEEEVRRTAEYYDELIADAMEAGETEEEAVASLPAPEDAANDQRPRPMNRRRRKDVPGWIWVLCGAALCAVIVLCVLPALNIHLGQTTGETPDAGKAKQQSGISQLIAAETDARMTATTQTYNPAEVKSIDIDSPVFSLELIAEQRQDIELTYYDRDGWRCAVTLKNSKLEVKYPAYRQNLKDFTNKKDYTVIMRVPLDYTAEYNVDANMANISASGCTGNMELSANMGSIEVSDCTGDLEINADMGDISVSGCTVGTLDLGCSMGSITLEDTAGKTLDLSCNMGSVDLDDIDYQQLTLEADAGSIEGTLAGAQADYTVTCKVGMGKSNVQAGGDGPRTLRIECDMGDVSLRFSDQQ